MKQQNFSISKRIQSFKYAFNGLSILLREEHNSRVHFSAAICVCIAGLVFKISGYEWVVIVLCISSVIAMEIINSAIENLCDFVTQEKNDQIMKIKDLAAAAVLITAMGAIIVGLIIFGPKILNLL